MARDVGNAVTTLTVPLWADVTPPLDAVMLTYENPVAPPVRLNFQVPVASVVPETAPGVTVAAPVTPATATETVAPLTGAPTLSIAETYASATSPDNTFPGNERPALTLAVAPTAAPPPAPVFFRLDNENRFTPGPNKSPR